MSTLPAASSFSGSADSEGVTGCTLSPTARKSPWAIAAYSGAWSALGNQSSITVKRFALADAVVTFCAVPQAVSVSAPRASRAASRRGTGILNVVLLSVRGCCVLLFGPPTLHFVK